MEAWKLALRRALALPPAASSRAQTMPHEPTAAQDHDGLAAAVPDELLMVRYRRGSRSSFRALVERHLGDVYTYAVHCCGSEETAQAATEHAFQEVVRRAAEYKHEWSFRVWLYGLVAPIIHNACPRPTAPSPAGRAALDVTPEQAPSSPTSAATLSQSALARQPPQQLQTLLLVELARLQLDDVASVTAQPSNTVQSQLKHALDELRQALGSTSEYRRSLR